MLFAFEVNLKIINLTYHNLAFALTEHNPNAKKISFG